MLSSCRCLARKRIYLMREMTEEKLGINREWLQEVRRIYLSSADRKIAELERAISGLEMNPLSHTHERRLRRLLHNLIGSGGSYGFPTVSAAARMMSECLKIHRDNHIPVEPAVLEDLRTRLNHLREVFNEARA